jgi:hypothetical protein
MPAHHAGKKRPGGNQGESPVPAGGYSSVRIVLFCFVLRGALLLLFLALLRGGQPRTTTLG